MSRWLVAWLAFQFCKQLEVVYEPSREGVASLVVSAGNILRTVLIDVEEVSAAVKTMHWELVLMCG